MDKVVLINLPSPWLISDRDFFPLGILSIAGYLRSVGVDVSLCDLAGLPEQYWQIPDADLYGISTTTPQYPYALKVIEKLRKRQRCRIAIGGIHPTVLPQRTAKETEADYIIVGEGETVMEQIAKNGTEWEHAVIHSPLIENIDDLPMAATDMLDIYSYMQIGTNAYISGAKREAYIQTARGCPYNCGFCCQRNMWKGRVRTRSLDKVCEEAEWYLDRYAVDQIYFDDDTFILDDQRVALFCLRMQELRERYRFVWHCLSRVDKVDMDMLGLMYESGCRCITYGIESGSNKILKKMHKGFDVEQARVGITMAKAAGLKVRAQMIVGFPGETNNTIEETAEFIRQNNADAWGIHAFVPFPGCDVWNRPERYGWDIDRENADFGSYHTIGKPGEWHAVINPNETLVRWGLKYLIEIAKDKNIFVTDAKRGHTT